MKSANSSRALLFCPAPLCALLCVLPAHAQPDVPLKPVLPEMWQISPAEAQKLVGIRPIALHLRDVTVSAALAELQKQSGVELTRIEGEADVLNKTLTLDIEALSFERALALVAEAVGSAARLRRDGYTRGAGQKWIVTLGAPGLTAPQMGEGPFQVTLQGVNFSSSRKATLVMDDAPIITRNEQLRVHLQPVLAPELQTVGEPRLRVTRASDDQGRSLLVAAAAPPIFGGAYFYRGPDQNVFVLKLLEGSRHLAHLEGVATYVLPANREHWEVPDVLTGQGAAHEFPGGGQQIRLEIKSVKRTGDGVRLEFRLTPALRTEGESSRYPLFSPQVFIASLHLQDANGQALRYEFSDPGLNRLVNVPLPNGAPNPGEGTTIQALFRPSSAPPVDGVAPAAQPSVLTGPVRLIFDGPTDFVKTEIPFSFEDVPLP